MKDYKLLSPAEVDAATQVPPVLQQMLLYFNDVLAHPEGRERAMFISEGGPAYRLHYNAKISRDDATGLLRVIGAAGWKNFSVHASTSGVEVQLSNQGNPDWYSVYFSLPLTIA